MFAMPYAKDSAMTFVDYRDVAEAAAIAFATDELVNGTFELGAATTCSCARSSAVPRGHWTTTSPN